MLNLRISLVAILGGVCIAATGMAQEMMIFPNDDQSSEQQEQDKFACYNWAKGESDFDPMAPPTATEAPPEEGAKKGGVGRGLVRGAAVGRRPLDGSVRASRTGHGRSGAACRF